jgi:two-component system, chemotaxis family, response regulator Rcp1
MVEPRERLVEILVVEKSYGAIVLLRRALLASLDFPYQLSIARDGPEAVALLHHHLLYRKAPWPDLILLALRLPHMTGWEVLRRIRATPALRNIPVIVRGGGISPEDEAQSKQLQPVVLLPKPHHYAGYESLAERIAELMRPHTSHAGFGMPLFTGASDPRWP